MSSDLFLVALHLPCHIIHEQSQRWTIPCVCECWERGLQKGNAKHSLASNFLTQTILFQHYSQQWAKEVNKECIIIIIFLPTLLFIQITMKVDAPCCSPEVALWDHPATGWLAIDAVRENRHIQKQMGLFYDRMIIKGSKKYPRVEESQKQIEKSLLGRQKRMGHFD